ncbi:DUF6716 putative glycosyltransferase [Streptomyces sp. TBY4]|uniref:DUF6716 putative glycosyltransferase n=1 Tax=Streptomyces sp. TBY4 TaxID=2962030 RepID=UPI0020B72351|nr:DUF6716 putative glycosyltransferase [Streptomyces sp. TBY4]MCP3760630.1 hypothetical protein [Streptomyces sp. TBY4]
MIREERHRVVVVADSDTRWKWGASVARQIGPDHVLDAYFLRTRATPTERQLAEIGIMPDSRRDVDAGELVVDEQLATADLLVLATAGGTTVSLLHSLGLNWAALEHRPITVTGYVGVVYEKLVDGLLTRAGADLVLANSAYDAERFREVFLGVGTDQTSVVETALPFMDGNPYDRTAAGVTRSFTVCFAVQPSVPRSKRARLRMLERAAEHARRCPERLVLMKLRSLPGEHTTHIEAHPYQSLIGQLDNPAPPNLQLVYGNMGEVLDRTDLLVTVSSTAALESLHRGIPTAILTDFGVREANGNHYFTNSGCLSSWSEIDDGHIPVPDPAWKAHQGIGKGDPYAAARARIAALRAAGPLPLITPYYTPQRASCYLPELLARHGLDERGRPLPVPLGGGPGARGLVPRHLRKMLRPLAKRVYQFGYQRVAPALRRVGGQL